MDSNCIPDYWCMNDIKSNFFSSKGSILKTLSSRCCSHFQAYRFFSVPFRNCISNTLTQYLATAHWPISSGFDLLVNHSVIISFCLCLLLFLNRYYYLPLSYTQINRKLRNCFSSIQTLISCIYNIICKITTKGYKRLSDPTATLKCHLVSLRDSNKVTVH